MLLSVPMSFIDHGPDRNKSMWVEAWNRRQAVQQEHESLSRTAMQRALEIDQLRVLCESLGNARTKLQPAQLAVEFGTMGLQSVQGGRKEDENDGKLTPNLISQALTVKRGILASARSVEILLQLEADYGTRSPFHQYGPSSCHVDKAFDPSAQRLGHGVSLRWFTQ